MKKYVPLVLAAAFSISVCAYAADFDSNAGTGGALDTLKAFGQGQPHGGGIPQPGHPQPGNHGDYNNHPGNHGNNNHPGNDHGGLPQPHPDYNHPDHPYSPVFDDMNCRTWEFTAQTPNTRTEKITTEEQGTNCYVNNGTTYCRPTGKYLSRKVTVNIGARQLESWEKESLKVCLDSGYSASVNTDEMLYEYTVASEDKDNNGFFGLGDEHSTVFTLTPGAKKLANPDSKELSIQATEIGEGGALFMTLVDARADYFKGEQITIGVEGMNVPEISSGMPVNDLLNAFVNIKASVSFPVAPLYNIKLTDKPKPGKYIVTITFTRRGQLSSSESASTTEYFEVK
ncbi:MAG TPA: hypothetical protein DCL44_02000 [Elusimicrobia bacterium]|nr:hypothetical protein [Elusimicrobiota bacterium]